MSRSTKVIIIVVIVIIALLALYASSLKMSGNPLSQMNSPLGSGGDKMVKVGQQKLSPENMIQGQVTDISNQNITILLTDGSTRKILLSGNTRIGKVVTGTIGDIAVGSPLLVNGLENSDGSVSAQLIQIRMQSPAGQKPQRN